MNSFTKGIEVALFCAAGKLTGSCLSTLSVPQLYNIKSEPKVEAKFRRKRFPLWGYGDISNKT
jgi:hypothetical protein